MSLVDAAIAPLLQRFEIIIRYLELPGYEDFTSLRQWWGTLAERPSVRDSVPEDFEDRLREFFRGKDSHFGRLC
jgi:glutathione S-transferase